MRCLRCAAARCGGSSSHSNAGRPNAEHKKAAAFRSPWRRDAYPVRSPKDAGASAQNQSRQGCFALAGRGGHHRDREERARSNRARLKHFGADLHLGERRPHGSRITLTGEPEPARVCRGVVPRSSSARFPLGNRIVVAGLGIVLSDVMDKSARTGLFKSWWRWAHPSKSARLRATPASRWRSWRRARKCAGVEVRRACASIDDEYLVLAVCGFFADGRRSCGGLKELGQGIDRLEAPRHAARLRRQVEVSGAILDRQAGASPRRRTVKTTMDHRIAMSALVMGLPPTSGEGRRHRLHRHQLHGFLR